MSKWNGKRFSIYTSDEENVLSLVEELGTQVNHNTDNIKTKTDLYGDHKGTWQGLDRPTMSEEGIRATVEDIVDNKIPSFQSSLDNMTSEITIQIDNLHTIKASKEYVDSKIGSMGSTKNFKGSCLFSALPTTSNVDDYWYVTDKNSNYCWNGTSWVDIGNNLNIADNSITSLKRTIRGSVGFIRTQQPINFNTTDKKLEFKSGHNFIVTGKRSSYPISDEIINKGLSLNDGMMIMYDISTETLRCGTLQDNENEILLGFYYTNNLVINANFTIDNKLPYTDKIVLDSIPNDSINLSKRTSKGNCAYFKTQHPMNFDTETKTLQFKAGYNFIATGKSTSYNIPEDIITNGLTLTGDGSSIMYNISTGTLRCGSYGEDENEVLLGIYFSNNILINGNYTIDNCLPFSSSTIETTLNKYIPSVTVDNGKENYRSGHIYFTVKVNQSFDDIKNTTSNSQDSENFADIPCVMKLPTNYKKTGKPSPVCMICHGAGGTVTSNSFTSALDEDYFVNAGYVVFDLNGGTPNYSEHMGASRALQAYKKAFEYIKEHYNVEDTLSIQGRSMGGLTALNFAISNPSIVKSVACFYPVTDLYNQAFLHPWFGDATLKSLAREYNFHDKTGRTYESEKIKGYNPIENNSILINGVRYNSFPVPLKIWHGTNDTTVSYEGSEALVTAMKNAGCKAYLRTLSDLNHITTPVIWNEAVMWINRWN